MTDRFISFIGVLDKSLVSKRKRHIVGGVLLSISLLFGGLAFTAMSLKEEKVRDKE